MPVPLILKNTASQLFPFSVFDSSGDIVKTPTLAAGDFVIFADFVSQGNITVTEDPAASGLLKAAPSQGQTNGDILAIRCEDQAGAEWESLWIYLDTETQQVGDLTPESGGNVAAIKAKTDNLPTDPATVTNQTTLLARLGAFTGTGVNTVLGFLQAMSEKAATLPSDIGGTFTPVTDSLEAIRDALRRTSLPSAAGTDDFAILRGDSYNSADDNPITGLGNIAARTMLWVTAKHSRQQADTEAIFMIEESIGLVYLNGAAATAGQGSITVTDAATGALRFELDEAATAELDPASLQYDIQMFDSTDITTLQDGKVVISADVTRAIT